MLDDLIAKAAEEKREIWVKVLAMHASTMSHLIGDLNSTRRYCEQVLAHDPNNALALFKMADVPWSSRANRRKAPLLQNGHMHSPQLRIQEKAKALSNCSEANGRKSVDHRPEPSLAALVPTVTARRATA